MTIILFKFRHQQKVLYWGGYDLSRQTQHSGVGGANGLHYDESQKVAFGKKVSLCIYDHLPNSLIAELEMGIKQIKILFLSEKSRQPVSPGDAWFSGWQVG